MTKGGEAVRIWRKLCIVACIAASIVPLQSEAAAAPSPVPVYVFAGQSNMVGAFAKAGEIAARRPKLAMLPSNVLFWGPTTDVAQRWARIEPPTEIWQSIVRNGFGPELSAADRLTSMQPGRTIGIFKFARNGTNLHKQWNPANRYGYYQAMTASLRVALREMTKKTGRPTRIAGFFWMQGESDADTAAHASAYGRNLQSLISALRRDMKRADLPVVIGQILDVGRWHRGLPHSEMVRYKQYQVAKADPRTFLVRTDGLAQDPASKIHFNTKGTIDLGYRMANPAFRLRS